LRPDISSLVVEDEPSVAEVVSLYLRRAGYEVRVVNNGQAALRDIEQRPPTLIVLDLMLPGLDGLAITRYVRERGDTPIIMLTARSQETDRIAGLEMGADDYVTKPFSPQELVSRVRAVLRRSRPAGAGESIERALTFDDLSIDPQTRLVTIRGEENTDGQRIRSVVAAGAPSAPGLLARSTTGARVGHGRVYRSGHGHRARAPPA
jgi:DNA-binding response OmpR family regulator